MAIADFLRKSEIFARENSGTILTSIGVVGTVTTAVLTGRSTVKAIVILESDAIQHRQMADDHFVTDLKDEYTFREKVALVWPVFVPPVLTCMSTVTAIVFANRIDSKKAAAMAAAYGVSERAFQEYRDKVVERMGETKATQIRDEIAQDKVRSSPPVTSQVIIVGDSDVMCFDTLTGRYFMSSAEKIRRAVNTTNQEIYRHEYASLSFFYDELEIPPVDFSNDVGWNHANICDVVISGTKTPDEKPCLAISFAHGPIANYNRFY